jgi:hypothetical protein
MIPLGLATYTENELELRAIQALRRRPDVEHDAPINVEFLIEGLPNVSLVYSDGLRAKHKVEGMVLKSASADKNIEVWVDTQIAIGPWQDYNAVLAEEFAHLSLHDALQWSVSSVEDFVALQNDPQWQRHESDARRFSDAIRMPSGLLAAEMEVVYAHVVNEHGFGDTLRAYGLIRSKLAGRFRVTPEDVLRRVQQPQVALENRVLNSLQSRSPGMIPAAWTVEVRKPGQQLPLFDRGTSR